MTLKKFNLSIFKKCMELNNLSSIKKEDWKGPVKYVSQIKLLKMIHWLILAIAKDLVELFIWVVSKTGLITKLKDKFSLKSELTTFKNFHVSSVWLLFPQS